MTNTINTLENLNNLANRMVNVQGLSRKDAENMAEWMLQSKIHNNDFEMLMKSITV